METVIRNVKTNPGGTIFNRTRQCLAYADNVVILGRAVRYVTETVGDVTTVATHLGLTINTTKTKYMINRKDNDNEPREIEISGQKYQKVETFKYLGSLVTNLNDIKTEIKTRLTAGNKCYHALGHILKKRYISQSIKVRLCKTVIRPIVTYGAETWTLTEKIINDMGKESVEKNIWTNKREWMLENKNEP
jgi:hypothetical protein